MKLFLCIVSLFLYTYVPSLVVQAQEAATSLKAAPAIVEMIARPGQDITQSINITNDSKNPLPVAIQIRGVIVEDEVLSSADKSRFDISKWIATAEDIIVISPQETKKIDFKVSVPENAISGGHYGGVSFRGLPLELDGRESLTRSVPEISVPFLITVPGPIHEKVELVQSDVFTTLSFSNSIHVNFEIENRGNIHNLIIPELVLRHNGQEIRREKLPASVVLPGTKRAISQTIYNVSPKSYSAYIELSYGSPKSLVDTTPENVYVIPEIWKIFVVGFIGYASSFGFTHRRNLLKATKTLLTGH